MKRVSYVLLAVIAWLWSASAGAQTLGYLVRGNCFTVTNPVAYQTVCLNSASGGSLTQGGLYVWTGLDWVLISASATTPTLDQAFDQGKTIDGAGSFANAFRVTDSSGDGIAIYRSAANGPTITCVISGTENACDKIVKLNASQKWEVQDDAAGAILSITEAGVTTYGANYRPKKTVYWDAGAISVDGTNCTAPTEQALNSAETTWAFSCADSNSSIFSGKVRSPNSYDGGTLLFTLSVFHDTTESITFAGDFSAQCRAAGTAINNTYGSAVAADVSITTANQIAEATTSAVTPNGSCAGGAWILWRYVVDAANFSANAANAKVLGVTMRFPVSNLSD